ncbi:MAG TPA: hypothetical protein VF789_30560 [Thermoanaerobaculia bacterium]
MALRIRLITLLWLGLAGLGAPALTQPLPGRWTGLTGQGERIEFVVQGDFVTDFELRGRWTGENCTGDFEHSIDFGVGIVGDAFVADFPFFKTRVEGRFASPTLAQGTLMANFTTGGCPGSVSTDWSASPEGENGEGAPPPSVPLTGAEVSCDAARLAALARRVSVDLPNSSKEASVALSLTRTGDFAGLAYSGLAVSGPEHLLTFSTNPEESTLLRNPERPQLFSLSATRNDLSSDLVAPGDPDEIRLTLNPVLGSNPSPGSLLVLDNVRLPGGSPTATRPGRGLADLLEPCHGKLTAADVHLFRLLSRLIRVRVEGAARYELAIFRGEEPHSYRIDIWPYGTAGAELGKIAARVDATYDSVGQLNRGTLRVFGPCGSPQETGCTTVAVPGFVELVTPTEAGGISSRTESLVVINSAHQNQDDIDWIRALQGTTWRKPL